MEGGAHRWTPIPLVPQSRGGGEGGRGGVCCSVDARWGVKKKEQDDTVELSHVAQPVHPSKIPPPTDSENTIHTLYYLSKIQESGTLESTLEGHSLCHCQVYERPHRGACRHRAGSNVCRVVGVDGRELVHIVNLHVQRCVCVCLCACVRPLALVCGRGRRMGAVSLGVGGTRGLRLTMMPPLSRIPRAVGLARQCSACKVAPFRRWKPATGSSAW